MDNFLTEDRTYVPDIKISAKQVFGIKSDIRVPAFSKISSFVPKIDKNYYGYDIIRSLNISFSEFGDSPITKEYKIYEIQDVPMTIFNRHA